jgi:hypothetical protein
MKNLNGIKKLAGAALALGALSVTTQASAAGELIVNEYNAVSDSKMLDDCKHTPAEGDQFFGCINGNGGDWIELVVTEDNLDIEGWTVYWENADTGSHANNGWFTFVDNSGHGLWSGLKAGTIIVVRDDGTATDVTDVGYSPCGGDNSDWVIEVDPDNTTYLSSEMYNGASSLGPGFKVDNDDWAVMIEDNASPSPNTVQGWVGENETLWAGAGVSGEEVGKLEANPAGGTSDTNYVDGDSSTFGGPNFWSGTGAPQSFDALCNVACGGSSGCCDNTSGAGTYYNGNNGYDCYERNYFYYY